MNSQAMFMSIFLIPSINDPLAENPAFGIQISTLPKEGLFSIHWNILFTSSSLPTSHWNEDKKCNQ